MYLNPFAKRMAQVKISTIKYSDMFQKKLEKQAHGIIYREGKLFYKKNQNVDVRGYAIGELYYFSNRTTR